jgi:hypothetical protein
LADLIEGYRQDLEHYRQHEEDAIKLTSGAEGPVEPQLDRAELAAWIAAANVVLNLDEVVSRN